MSDKNTISSTTQEYLDVYDITNDLVILKDGVISIIMQIGTMNFSLLAEQEQDAVMYTYGAMLNSLNFPVQINIQSSVKDATKYLRLLDVQIKQAKTIAKARLIEEYRDFVANLIRERNVLEKKFFVVIPTNAAEMGLYSAENVLPGKTEFDIGRFEKTILIEKATTVLDPRRDHLVSQFNRLGLFARQLDTQEIIQNFYVNYNPESTEGQEVAKSESYTTPIVRASLTDNSDLNQAGQNLGQNLISTLGQNSEQSTAIDSSTIDLVDSPSTDLDVKLEERLENQANEITTPITEQEIETKNTFSKQEQGVESANFSESVGSLQQTNLINSKIPPPNIINQAMSKNKANIAEL